MNTLRKNILIGLAALSMGATAIGAQAQAQAQEGRFGHAATQEQRQAKMAEHFAMRQAKLHDALKLTPAQEPAWNAFTSAMKPAPHAQRGDRAAGASLSAPARMEQMIARSKERTAQMEARLPALNKFYAALTPEQKKVFDEQAMRDHRGGHRGHHGDGMKHKQAESAQS